MRAVVGAEHLLGHGGVRRGEQGGDLGQGCADRVGVVRVGHVVLSSCGGAAAGSSSVRAFRAALGGGFRAVPVDGRP
ncbi:hypothetical protein SCMC78_72910 [Streptomyces sp. CMC78]|uniref:Uncharacterized protein n=1 Tax=Streptomyces sp. CMC78 TaxID=3231512 RepID=A0AB33KPX2_9ACTN